MTHIHDGIVGFHILLCCHRGVKTADRPRDGIVRLKTVVRLRGGIVGVNMLPTLTDRPRDGILSVNTTHRPRSDLMGSKTVTWWYCGVR